jgi:hypothetical protein
MDGLRKRFVMLVVPVALILFASFLAAQGPPGCANACWQAYTDAVKACHGDPACLAKARADALACVQGCGLPPR